MITGWGTTRTKGRPCMNPNDPQHASWVLLLMVVGEGDLATPPLRAHFATGSKARAAEKKKMDEQTVFAYCNLLVPMTGRSSQDDHIAHSSCPTCIYSSSLCWPKHSRGWSTLFNRKCSPWSGWAQSPRCSPKGSLAWPKGWPAQRTAPNRRVDVSISFCLIRQYNCMDTVPC